jgi:hypothetical protein
VLPKCNTPEMYSEAASINAKYTEENSNEIKSNFTTDMILEYFDIMDI